MPDYELKFDHRHSVWCIPLKVVGRSRRKWVSTGERLKARAKAVLDESGIERLALLQQAGALTAEAIALVTTGRRRRCSELIADWGRYLNTINSGTTPSTYVAIVTHLINYANCNREGLATCKAEDISAFVNHPKGGMATRQQKLTAIRQFFRWANAKGYIIGNEAELIRIDHRNMTVGQLEGRKTLPLTDEEYRTCLAGLPLFWRWATALSYWTAMRMIDVCCLEKESIQPEQILLYTKKRLHRIALPLADPLIGGGELKAVLADILKAAPAGIYCFPDARNLMFSTQRWQLSKDYTERLRKMGIQGKSFHSVRHSAITRYRQAGKTLEEIGKMVGHANQATTAGYVHELINASCAASAPAAPASPSACSPSTPT